jgi:hypothetical protein
LTLDHLRIARCMLTFGGPPTVRDRCHHSAKDPWAFGDRDDDALRENRGALQSGSSREAREVPARANAGSRGENAARTARTRKDGHVAVESAEFSPQWGEGLFRDACKSQKRLVGASGFEPETSCAQGRRRKSILLVRLALFYVMVHGFGPNLTVLGPKLDPSFFEQVGRRQAGAAQETQSAEILCLSQWAGKIRLWTYT